MSKAVLLYICLSAAAVDGDTLKCADGTRLRLVGVEANEMRGGCHIAACPDMPGPIAKQRMQALVGGQNLTYRPRRKSWNRIEASVYLPDGRDLSCEALRLRIVARWEDYWPKGLTCGR